MKLTEEQRQRMGLNNSVETNITRGWTKNQIKEAIAEKGFQLLNWHVQLTRNLVIFISR